MSTLLDDLGIAGDVEADEMTNGVVVHEHGERVWRLGIEQPEIVAQRR